MLKYPKIPLTSESNASNRSEAVTLDDLLVYLGEFACYQKFLFCVLLVFCMFLTFVYFTQSFLVVLPSEYWCRLPEVKQISKEKLRQLMIPSSKLVPYEGHGLTYSRCWIYDLSVEKVLTMNKTDESLPLKKCKNWEFNLSFHDVPYMSVAAEQNWVCDQAYKSTLAQSIFFVGAIFGGLIFDCMADKYGRLPVLVGANMMGFIGGISTMYINEFWHFCVCRFVVGLAFDNTFTVAYVLVLEYVGIRWRTFFTSMTYGMFYTLGATVIPWMAYGIADWRMLALATSAPLASVIVAPFIMPESVRWLISKKKFERALNIIAKIEKMNNSEVPQEVYEEFLDDCVTTAENMATRVYTVRHLFKTPRMRRITILLTICWGIVHMVYDAQIRCLDHLGMDVFTTFTMASATEFPAEIIMTRIMDTFGRRWTFFGSILLSGLVSFVAAYFPVGVIFASLAICGRFFINVASNISIQYTAELLPTVVRGKMMGLIQVFGYCTSTLSPFIAFSSIVMHNLPMLILGTACTIGAILSLFLPETLMEQLPQSMLDGELFGIDQSFWDTPFSRKTPLEPKGHHLHAKHPASRPGMMRSSMVSGLLGNRKRLHDVRERAKMYTGQERSVSTSNSPNEYLQKLRKKAKQQKGTNSRYNSEDLISLDSDISF